MRPSINDDELIEAVEAEADKYGSKAEAVRHAIRETYLNSTTTRRYETVEDIYHNEEANDVHRQLFAIANPHDKVNVRKIKKSQAETVISQIKGVPADVIKSMYLDDLLSYDVIDMNSTHNDMMIYVVDPDAPAQLSAEGTDDSDDTTNDIDPNDRLDQIDNAEPVRADGGEKTNPDDDHSDDNEETTAA